MGGSGGEKRNEDDSGGGEREAAQQVLDHKPQSYRPQTGYRADNPAYAPEGTQSFTEETINSF